MFQAVRPWGCFSSVLLALLLVSLYQPPHPLYLSVGALALATAYPFMKRYTYLPQVVLLGPRLPGPFPWRLPPRPALCRPRPGWCTPPWDVDHRLRYVLRHGGPGGGYKNWCEIHGDFICRAGSHHDRPAAGLFFLLQGGVIKMASAGPIIGSRWQRRCCRPPAVVDPRAGARRLFSGLA